MDWLDKHMVEGQRIRDELNGVVVSFPDSRIPDDISALNKYEGLFRGLGMPVPKFASVYDFKKYMMMPSTADKFIATIISTIRTARGYYEVTN